MGMSLREISALDRESKSREALAKAIKSGGKEYEKQREALEKAVGGKAKIDKADKILADAENYAAELRTQAATDALETRRQAENEAKARAAALDKRAAELDQKEVAQKGKATELLDREKTVKEREAEAKKVDTQQANTAAALAKRETDVGAREAANAKERSDLEAWRARLEAASRPA